MAFSFWSVDLKMPFNSKCEVIAFGSQNNYRPTHKLGEAVMDWADTTTYLGVAMQQQSNLKFDQHIHSAQERQSFENSGSSQAHSKAGPTRRPVTGLH